jgi:hypothetical protein
MKKNFRIATMAYLIFLGATLGAILYAGAVVAPVTFGSEKALGGEVLSHYQEGLIMTQNFVRLSYWLLVMIVVVVLYEGYRFKMGEHGKLEQAVTILVLASALLFNYYYLPDIVLMQSMGAEATQTARFSHAHAGSEIDFKVLAAAILALMIVNMRKACK